MNSTEVRDIFEEQDSGIVPSGARQVPAALSGMAIREYLLVLRPTSTIWDEMMEIKKQVAEWCHCPQAAHSQPYIPLLRFAQVVPAEEAIVKKMTLLTQPLLPLRITLENYSGIPRHTLELPLAPDPLFTHFMQQLKALQAQLTLYRTQKPVFYKKPAIGIARHLQPGDYEEGLSRLLPLEYSNVFVAKECLLLSRPRGEQAYKRCETFYFRGIPATPKAAQVSLF